MFEFHGWINVRYHMHDTDQRLQQQCWKQVTSIFKSYGFPLSASLRQNGMDTIHFAGHHNHKQTAPLDLLNEVGAIAPGSYGLIHIYDDEHPENPNCVQKHILKRGKVYSSIETALSRYTPEVEDPYDETRND